MSQDITQNSTTDTSAILKELSDIKSNLAVNSSETINIKSTIAEIKVDLRDIKQNFVTQTQYKDHEDRIRSQETFRETLNGKIWGIGLMVSTGVTIISLLVSHYWK